MGIVLSVAEEGEGSFLYVFIWVMGKSAYLNEFDIKQIVMTQSLGISISETTQLVGCSQTAVISQ